MAFTQEPPFPQDHIFAIYFDTWKGVPRTIRHIKW